MSLPELFQFSQGSLQDYVDCPRRFQLKYIQQLAWPALEAEPALENEHYLQKGAAFHRLAQQYLLGVPTEKLTRLAEEDTNLERWWEHFVTSIPNLAGLADSPRLRRYPEISLSAPLGEYRLVGKYDLLIVDNSGDSSNYMAPGAIIYDWKTSRQQPKRSWIAANLQTRVYPYLLAKAGAQFNAGKAIPAEQIEMVYWFANFPAAPLCFPYSPAQYTEDEIYLISLIDEIKTINHDPALMTDNQKRCRFCIYRSLCDRGVAAGPFAELQEDLIEESFDFDLDLEQIAEVEF